MSLFEPNPGYRSESDYEAVEWFERHLGVKEELERLRAYAAHLCGLPYPLPCPDVMRQHASTWVIVLGNLIDRHDDAIDLRSAIVAEAKRTHAIAAEAVR